MLGSANFCKPLQVSVAGNPVTLADCVARTFPARLGRLQTAATMLQVVSLAVEATQNPTQISEFQQSGSSKAVPIGKRAPAVPMRGSAISTEPDVTLIISGSSRALLGHACSLGN